MIVAPAQTTAALRLWTVKDYHCMVDAGILQPDESVELIAGQILRKMSPQNSRHSAAITRTDRLLRQRLGGQVLVRLQLPIELHNYSEPEPDLAIVQPDPLDYDDRHPTATNVYLIIEVSDSTLTRDLDLKAKDYAASGIKDYWVLDVNKRQLHVFRHPTAAGYQSEQIFSAAQFVVPLRFPDCRIGVAEMLRPQ